MSNYKSKKTSSQNITAKKVGCLTPADNSHNTLSFADTALKEPHGVTRGSNATIPEKISHGSNSEVACDPVNPVSDLDFSITPFIHWIQGTFKTLDSSAVTQLEQLVSLACGSQAVYFRGQGSRRGIYFANTCKLTCGSQILWNEPDSDHSRPFHIWFSISGEACERMGLYGSYSLMMAINLLGDCKFTRIDTKVRLGTGWQQKFTLQDIKTQAEAATWLNKKTNNPLGNFEGFNSYRCISSGDIEGVDESLTVYFGSPSSDKMIRFYDPFHNHGVHGMDIETQFKDSYAQTVFYLLDDLGEFPEVEAIAAVCSSTAIGSINFIDRTKSDRAYRCPRLTWWQEFLDASQGTLKIVGPRQVKTFQKSIKWMEKQVFPTLAAILEAFSGDAWDWLGKRLDHHASRLSNELWSLIDEVRQNDVRFFDILVT